MAILKRRYYLGVGSNLEPQQNLRSCLNYLRCSFQSLRLSPTYRSAAYGFEGPDFLNLVVEVRTAFEPHGLKAWLQRLEDRHGRDRQQPRYSNRHLDIDLLLCDDWILNDPQLTLPRPEILKRHYVLKPLQDLAPDLIHPIAQKRLAQLWQALSQEQPSRLEPVSAGWP